jgi:hypothetical protein
MSTLGMYSVREGLIVPLCRPLLEKASESGVKSLPQVSDGLGERCC